MKTLPLSRPFLSRDYDYSKLQSRFPCHHNRLSQNRTNIDWYIFQKPTPKLAFFNKPCEECFAKGLWSVIFSRHKYRVFFAWPVSSENCIRWMTKSMWCDMLSVKWSGSTWLYQSDIWTVVAFNCYSKLWEYLHPTLEDPAFLKSLPNPFDVTMNCLIRIRVLYCDSLFVPSILPNGVLLHHIWAAIFYGS